MQIVSVMPIFLEMNWAELSLFFKYFLQEDANDCVETKSHSVMENYICKASFFHVALNISSDYACFQQVNRTKQNKSSKEPFII